MQVLSDKEVWNQYYDKLCEIVKPFGIEPNCSEYAFFINGLPGEEGKKPKDTTKGNPTKSNVFSELEKAGINIMRSKGEVEVIKRSYGRGVQLTGGGILMDCTLKDINKMLMNYRINSALVKISGKIKLEDIENSIFLKKVYKPTIIIVNKSDLSIMKEEFSLIKESIEKYDIPLLVCSCKNKFGLENLGKYIFQILNIIRIYTKEPNSKATSKKPIVMEKNSTVLEAAKKLHTENN